MEERIQHRTPAPVRLRFVLDRKATDLAFPSRVALADVLPAVLPALSPSAADLGSDHDGWVVQRLGGPPLDEERSAAELNLVDGETVYLRPRASQFPPIRYDDLVDGVAEQVRTGSGVWTPGRSASMLSTFAGLVLLLGVPVLVLGGPVGARAATAATLAVFLLGAAGLASRAAARPAIGSVLAGVAAVYAAVAGWFGASWAAPAAAWPVLVAATTIAGLTALCVGLALVADASLLFAAGMTFSVALCLPTLVAAAGAIPPRDAAAIGLVFTLVGGMFLPLLAFRLGGLTLPLLPGNAKELGQDIEPVPYEFVVARGTATIGYLTALCAGLAAAQVLLAGALLLPGGGWAMLLAVTASVWLLLRSRHLGTTPQRWAVMMPAMVLAAGAAVRWAADHDFFARATVIVPALAVVGALFAIASATLPGRRLAPFWGRGAEILELLVAIAILPELGAVLNVYQIVRAWTGG